MEQRYEVRGMTCGGCVASVTRAIERANPGVTVDVELETATVTVKGAHETPNVEDAVIGAGFEFEGLRD